MSTLHTHRCAFRATHFRGGGSRANRVRRAAASTVAVQLQYRYGPFGELIRATGPMAKLNPFRFSTKYQDDETDLIYYGYRYYNASTGRWLSRDPIGERGGKNLYGFVSNRPINKIDVLGHFSFCPFKCGGKYYNPITSCCCKKNGTEEILSRSEIDTGVSICFGYKSGMAHSWVEMDSDSTNSWSAGFGPAESVEGPSLVDIPEEEKWTVESKKYYTKVKLSPCVNDISKFRECIKKTAEKDKANPPPYVLPFFTCAQWANGVVMGCMQSGSQGCGK